MKSLCETCKDISCFDYETNTNKECLNYEKMTNADRIRAMSDEELAKELWRKSDCPTGMIQNGSKCFAIQDCERCWLDWLKREVEDGRKNVGRSAGKTSIMVE